MTQESLSDEQIRALLAACMAYDNRKPGQANIAAWREAAHRARWRFKEALEAIHEHYATSTEFLMPGHITARLRANARHPEPYAALPPACPASEDTRRRVMAIIGDAFAMPRDVDSSRPAPSSPEHRERMARARAELDRIRDRAERREAS